MIGTTEAARRLGFHQSRIRQLIDEGKLSATFIGNLYILDEADVERYRASIPEGYVKPGPKSPVKAT